jgi:hypothetical protein
MTESEWLTSSDPARMLRHLTTELDRDPPPSDRKLKLFVTACLYRFDASWHAIRGSTMTLSSWQEVSALLRDIFGNPFRPVKIPNACWRLELGFTVHTLAQTIYDERAFDRLPILADAMEEAGCTEETLLRHLRGEESGPHVRGCWALDLILGKE